MTLPFTCIVCADHRHRLIFQKAAWHYYQCRSCGSVTLQPRPSQEQLLACYRDYLPVGARRIRAWEKMIRPVVAHAARLIETRYGGADGKLLDVGCGFGFFLKHMAALGWWVEGVELSPTGCRYARHALGLRVHQGPLEQIEARPNLFDVVTLFYVIEHVQDPVSLLRRIYAILKPGGMILIRWPHSTPIVKLFGPLAQRFDIYHTPYHLYDFNPQSIRMLLQKAGFGAVQTDTGGYTLPAHLGYRLASVWFSTLATWLGRLSGSRVLLPGVSKTTIGRKAAGKRLATEPASSN